MGMERITASLEERHQAYLKRVREEPEEGERGNRRLCG